MTTTPPSFSFSNASLERMIDNYTRARSGEEVNVCLFGNAKDGVFTIRYLFPMHNCSEKGLKRVYCLSPGYIDEVIQDLQHFTGLRFIGSIHNHPGERSQRSNQDTSYFGTTAVDWGRDLIFGVIGNRKTMRMYHVSVDGRTFTISMIQGKTYLYKLLSR